MERKFAWKKNLILVVGILLTFALASCSLTAEAPAAAEPTPSPVPIPTAEPVITIGDALPMALTDSSAVPAGYTQVETEDPNLSLYAFTDADGVVQYRVYGGYTEFVDGVAGQVYTGFYPSDETGAILAEATAFVDPAAEAFGVAAVTAIPDTIRLRTKYTLAESGLITGAEGGTFVYGSFNGGEGAFYPADSNGKMVPGALPTAEKIAVPPTRRIPFRPRTETA